MANVLNELSEISGLPKKDAENIWEEIKENKKKLNSCKKHQFGKVKTKPLCEPVPCRNCGGFMNKIDILSYQGDYVAAGGNPDDICVFV